MSWIDEARPAEDIIEAERRFKIIIENLDGETIARVRRFEVTKDERAASSKIDAACRALDEWLRFSDGAIEMAWP